MKIRYSFFILIIALTLFTVSVAFGQQSDREAGINAFNGRNYPQAIQLLKKATKNNGSDAEAWHYLGASYLGAERNKDAIKAMEKAVSLEQANDRFLSGLSYAYMRSFDPRASSTATKALEANVNNPQAHYVLGILAFRNGSFGAAYERAKRTITLMPDYAGAFLLKSESLVSSFSVQTGTVQRNLSYKHDLLSEAATDLERYVSLISENKERQRQTEYLASLKFFADYYNRPENQKVISIDKEVPDPTATNLKIISKSPAPYTVEARSNNISGTIRLLIEFATDGKVRNILITKRLGNGLDENAIDAARNIRFTPATRNGVPFSVVKTVEYSFSIY